MRSDKSKTKGDNNNNFQSLFNVPIFLEISPD